MGFSKPFQWHNYAVRLNVPEKRLTIWADRQCRGTIDLARITFGMAGGGTWASLPWSGKLVSFGGMAWDENRGNRVWTDNFRVGTPSQAAKSAAEKPDKTTQSTPSKH